MFEKIMVAMEEGVIAQPLVQQAVDLALCHRADLFFFMVVPSLANARSEPQTESTAHNSVMAACLTAEQAGVRSQWAVGSDTDTAQSVAAAAISRRCDVILVGKSENSQTMQTLNAFAMAKLISVATVPVLVCTDKGTPDVPCWTSSPTTRSNFKALEQWERRHRENND